MSFLKLATASASTNPSPRKPPPFQHDSSTESSSSSSGYSSLPILDDQSSGDYSGPSSSLNPSHSLPATPCHFQAHRQTTHKAGSGYRCRNSGKMTRYVSKSKSSVWSKLRVKLILLKLF